MVVASLMAIAFLMAGQWIAFWMAGQWIAFLMAVSGSLFDGLQ